MPTSSRQPPNPPFTPTILLSYFRSLDPFKIFAEPVEADIAPDYYDVITQPMDFQTMTTKLQRYANTEAVLRDIELICRNCKAYNAAGTVYFDQASALERAVASVRRAEAEFKRTHGEDAARKRGLSRGTDDAPAVEYPAALEAYTKLRGRRTRVAADVAVADAKAVAAPALVGTSFKMTRVRLAATPARVAAPRTSVTARLDETGVLLHALQVAQATGDAARARRVAACLRPRLASLVQMAPRPQQGVRAARMRLAGPFVRK